MLQRAWCSCIPTPECGQVPRRSRWPVQQTGFGARRSIHREWPSHQSLKTLVGRMILQALQADQGHTGVFSPTPSPNVWTEAAGRPAEIRLRRGQLATTQHRLPLRLCRPPGRGENPLPAMGHHSRTRNHQPGADHLPRPGAPKLIGAARARESTIGYGKAAPSVGATPRDVSDSVLIGGSNEQRPDDPLTGSAGTRQGMAASGAASARLV